MELLTPLTSAISASLKIYAPQAKALPFIVRRMDRPHVGGGGHWHDFPQLWYTVSGSYKQRINGELFNLTRGSLAFIHPFTIHSIEDVELSGEPPCVISITIYEDLHNKNIMPFQPLTYNTSSFDRYLIYPVTTLSGKDRDLADVLFENSLEEFSHKWEMNQKTIYNNIAKIFELMSRNSPSDKISPIKLSRAYTHFEHIRQVTEFIAENSLSNLTLPEITKYSMMSQSVFCDKFKNCTGQTYYSYFKACHLDHVVRMLRFSDMSLPQIAEKCEFYDTSHLRHTIREVFGVSPSELREQLRAKSRETGALRHKQRMEDLGWMNVLTPEEEKIYHDHSTGVVDNNWARKCYKNIR